MTPPTRTKAAKRGKATRPGPRPAKSAARPAKKARRAAGPVKPRVKAVKRGRTGGDPPKEVSARLEAVGGAIRAERLRQNVSAETIARLLGVRRQVIGRVERGEATVGVGSWLGTLWVLGLLDRIDVKTPDAGARRRARGAPFVPF